MIKSMTGYGKAVAETPGKKITVEIKSLNSKQFDLSAKLPWLYKEKEPEIRNLVSQHLDRGKIDFAIFLDILDEESSSVINKPAVLSYYRQFREIADELNISLDGQIFSSIMKFPDTLKSEKPELPESEWELLKPVILQSINMLDQYRADEGKSQEIDMKKCLSNILTCMESIGPHEEGRIKKVREKLLALLEGTGTENIDRNRFEQELIFYLEKYDINEEKVRLRTHCDYFIETMGTPSPNGRLLNFIAQEMGREINTIGSKANDASIQRLVVMMKDELEKIKEQTLNVL